MWEGTLCVQCVFMSHTLFTKTKYFSRKFHKLSCVLEVISMYQTYLQYYLPQKWKFINFFKEFLTNFFSAMRKSVPLICQEPPEREILMYEREVVDFERHCSACIVWQMSLLLLNCFELRSGLHFNTTNVKMHWINLRWNSDQVKQNKLFYSFQN